MKKNITLTFTKDQAFGLITGIQVLWDSFCILDSGIPLSNDDKAGMYELNQLSKRIIEAMQKTS